MQPSFNTDRSDNNHSLIPGPSTEVVLSNVHEVALAAISTTSQVGWDDAVEAFLTSALDSENTRRAYRRHLRNARAILGVESVAEVTGADLAGYRATILSNDLAPASNRQSLSALRSFLTWVTDMGGPAPSSRVVKVALRTPRGSTAARYSTITELEVGKMLAEDIGLRERAIAAVLLGAGVRIAEAAHLDVADLFEDSDGGAALFVRQGKGRKDRVVPIQPEVDAIIRTYLVATGRMLGDAGRLFLASDRSARGRAPGLSTRAISRIVKELAAAAGITAKRVSPHSLRHTYAMRALRSGGNVVAVARLLGHSNIATTQRYVDHLANSELRSTVPVLPVAVPEE